MPVMVRDYISGSCSSRLHQHRWRSSEAFRMRWQRRIQVRLRVDLISCFSSNDARAPIFMHTSTCSEALPCLLYVSALLRRHKCFIFAAIRILIQLFSCWTSPASINQYAATSWRLLRGLKPCCFFFGFFW